MSWTAPAANGSAITGYVVTPYLDGVAQTAISYGAGATTQTLTGLTAGGSYTFTVAAVNAYGTSTASAPSAAVTPYTVPGPPSITAATAGDSTATLTWNAPSSTGSSPVTAYVVTPYVGGVARPSTTFAGTGTTPTVTGLTPGTTYTFTVAARNAAGTGAPSAVSPTVVPNDSPSLTFPAPPAGEVGVAYRHQLTVTNGTAPFSWSVSSGTLPAGVTLNPSTGLLSGTPTASGTSTVTVRVTDASAQTATRSVTLVIAAAPTVAFSPPAGEVGFAYSAQPAVNGGTAPFRWAVTAGSLPAGVTLDPATGLVSGTPTTAGTFSVTLTATDAFDVTASRTTSITIAALPTFSPAPPPNPQAGVAYSTALAVSGGTAPFTFSVAAGALPAGLTLDPATGTISGTPTTPGTSSATVAVQDASGATATRALTLVVAAGPNVITKTGSTTSTVAGGRVSFTVTVANTGSQPADVVLSDALAGVLDDATYDGTASASTGAVTYSAPTLTWRPTVAAGRPPR